MACKSCGKNYVLFPPENICFSCLRERAQEKAESGESDGEYIVRWKLQDSKGESWIEEMEHMTLSDFEVAYGNIIHDILWIQMRKKNQAVI